MFRFEEEISEEGLTPQGGRGFIIGAKTFEQVQQKISSDAPGDPVRAYGHPFGMYILLHYV